jgi:hypothetical protein
MAGKSKYLPLDPKGQTGVLFALYHFEEGAANVEFTERDRPVPLDDPLR